MGTYIQNRTILYVDDEPALLSSFSSLMKKSDVEVRLLPDSAGIETMLHDDGPFAVVCSDQRMPGLDGVGVLETVQRLHPATIRVMITGHAGHADTLRAINVGGIAHFVTKPWNDDELRRLMTGCIDRFNLAMENRFLLEEVAATNLSLRRLAEDHLRQNVEQFRLMAENVDDLVAVVDRNGRRIYNSPSYRELLGDPESLKGTSVFLDIHPDDRERAMSVFQEIVRTGIAQRVEYRIMARDGSVRTLESKGGVIRDAEGTITQGIVVSRDVTEERKLAAQFLRAQRMESIGTLAGGIAHDLNNVLTPIMMAIEVLKGKMSDKHGLKLLNTIETSATRGSSIVRQVLAFGRGVKGDRIVVQLKHVIKEVVQICGETFPKSIAIDTELSRDLWVVSADPTQMHQVLLNLLVNARDAMPRGGTITIAAANLKLDDNFSRMQPDAAPGPYVSLTISDTGSGIPAEIREKIFEPFFTTKELGMGTGLGLSTTLAIVKGHRGFIDLESEPGKGTTFRVCIPATATAPESAAPEGEAEPPMGNGELILIIDDEAAIREITKETLQTFGYNVLTATDGAEGVAVFAEHSHTIRVVITDMMMPVMDGGAAIRALKRMSPDIKIIAVSGVTQGEQGGPASDAGAQVVLTKPFTAMTLLTTLSEVMR
jgi:PAS domain S-box-containing protein